MTRMSDDRTNVLLENLLESVRQVSQQQNAVAERQARTETSVLQLVENERRRLNAEVIDAQESAKYRNGVRTELAEVGKQVMAMRMEQASHNQIVTEVKTSLSNLQKKVQTYEDLKLQAKGGAKVIIWLSRAAFLLIGALSAAAGTALQHWLTLPRPPH